MSRAFTRAAALAAVVLGASAAPADASGTFVQRVHVLHTFHGPTTGTGAFFGWAVSELRDVDGDGVTDAVIGEVDGGWQPLGAALNAARAGSAAELVGVAAGASAMTLDYLRQRKQFGKLIGEFQALQHRAAHLYGEIEIARAASLKAARLLDDGEDRAELFVSVAKAKAADVASLAVREGVQMHGGIGMTDEHDIGLFMKREAVLGELFGDVFYHRGRVASLSGY